MALTVALIERASVTPADAGCLDLIGARLHAAGFSVHRLPSGQVDNLWAVRGTSGPCLAFAGHTDVVPPGPLASWTSPPFEPQVRDGRLYGRGAADMKGSLAAMVVAAERFVAAHPVCRGRLGFLLTSDEEGPATDGTVKVVEYLASRGELPDWCIVGEPSSNALLGDTLRVGRRGSLNGHLQVHGTQGHVAYPERADNPIHRALTALTELTATRWDEGNAHFPPTSLQISNIHGGTGAENVIPQDLEVRFNFRFSTEHTAASLRAAVEGLLIRHELRYTLVWHLSGEPFLTAGGRLVETTAAVVAERLGVTPERSTGGGTSDGRFIAPRGVQLVELGPINATIHKVDECVDVNELDALTDVYALIMERMLAD